MELFIPCPVCKGKGPGLFLRTTRLGKQVTVFGLCPECSGAKTVPLTQDNCEHEYRWLGEGPDEDSAAVRECRFCGKQEK